MPLYKSQKTEDGLHIAIWKISETAEELAHLLSNEQLKEIRKRHLIESRVVEQLAVRALLFEMTGKHLIIDHKDDGKPFIPHFDRNISISHTRGFAAVALHPSRRPGIDIEYMSKRIMKVRSHVFSSGEMEQVSIGHNEEDSALLSTIYWCAKETAFKIIGHEVYNFKEAIHVQPFIQQTQGKLEVCIKTNTTSVLPVFYTLYPDFILTWGLLQVN